MPAPYDYSRAMPKMPDPFGSYARGADLKYGLQQQEVNAQQQELKTQQQQIELANQRAAAQRRIEMQDAIAGLMQNKSSRAIRDVMTQFPETIETLTPLFSEYTTQELQQKISTATPIYAALQSNRPDLAKDIYEQRAVAAENAGDLETARIARAKGEQAINAPDVARLELGMTLATAMGLDKFGDTFGKLETEYRARASQPGEIAKQDFELMQLGLNMGIDPKNTQEIIKSYRGAKLPQETSVNLLTFEAGSINGQIYDPEKRYQAAKDLRTEYNRRFSSVTDGRINYEKMLESAKIQAGLGDVALITSFMKMLDEGSVVRDSEFATARDTAGLYESLKNYLEKAKTGEFLSDSQRKVFTGLAKSYLEAAEKDGAKTRKSMEGIVNRLGLNPADVFVDVIEEAPATFPEITTQEQYDALPSGSVYTENGQQYRKP